MSTKVYCNVRIIVEEDMIRCLMLAENRVRWRCFVKAVNPFRKRQEEGDGNEGDLHTP